MRATMLGLKIIFASFPVGDVQAEGLVGYPFTPVITMPWM